LLPTAARLSLGRTVTFVSTHDQLQFQLDHARARDAVHEIPDFAGLLAGLRERGLEAILLESAIPAGDGARQAYLRRPDLGRRLSARSVAELQAQTAVPGNIVLVIADGLSALAIDRHVLPLVDALSRAGIASSAPVCVVRNGRVAIGDEIGQILGAEMTILLIGERPGLSAPDSLGVYLTSHPRIGRTDAERNCISNIRLEGLSYDEAAHRIAFYLRAARELGGTGYALKDSSSRVSPNLPAIG
jgi:ethanolamine ammonia-lyase small subunit